MMVSKFWKTIDELADAATDRREWQSRLGDEWDRVSSLLTPTGSLAMSVACPSPRGDGCPRRIVRHDDGSIRAICGDSPKTCRDLDLSKDDIVILRLDHGKLASAVARAFGLSNFPRRLERSDVAQIGTYDVFAGRGFPVFLCVPGPRPIENIQPFHRIMALPGPKLLLVPTVRSIADVLSASLDHRSVTVFVLEDCLAVAEIGLVTTQPVEVLFSELHAELVLQTATGSSNLVWPLPRNARWEELTIRFIAASWINVTFRGEVRGFAPEDLGMKNRKRQDGAPTSAWLHLHVFALAGGRLPVHHASEKETSKHQKQKQTLSKALRSAFGITEDPIPTEGSEYVTRFIVSAEDLEQGRQGQRRRNFAGPD